MNDYANISKTRIRQLINERCGGSQQTFADLVGINKASVSQYVNGRNAPTNITAKKIADVFNVSPAWIMGFNVPKYETNTTAEKLEALTPGQREVVEMLIDALLKSDDN